MENLDFWICWFFIMIITLVVVIPKYVKVVKATNVVNYDWTRRKFVYKVYMSKKEIVNSLKIMNIKDELSCTFDLEKNTVIITDLSLADVYKGAYKEYFYEIREYDGFSILQLSVASIFSEGNDIWLKLNPFMVSKINAEIVPFSQYGK